MNLVLFVFSTHPAIWPDRRNFSEGTRHAATGATGIYAQFPERECARSTTNKQHTRTGCSARGLRDTVQRQAIT